MASSCAAISSSACASSAAFSVISSSTAFMTAITAAAFLDVSSSAALNAASSSAALLPLLLLLSVLPLPHLPSLHTAGHHDHKTRAASSEAISSKGKACLISSICAANLSGAISVRIAHHSQKATNGTEDR